MRKQIEFQDELMQKAEEYQKEVNEKHLWNRTEEYEPLATGTYVTVNHESGKPPHKLAGRWHGPYRILNTYDRPQGIIYECYNPATGQIAEYHMGFVQPHPCRDDVEATRSIVLDRTDLFMVDEVLEHRINMNGKRPSLDLRIKWMGYKEPEWTGMNISLKRNSTVKDYLKAKELDSQFGLSEKDNAESEPQAKRIRFSSSTKEA
jgi:hypothetical protein